MNMGNELRHFCPVETRRLLLLVGLFFALVLIVQHILFLDGDIWSSLFSSGKSPVALSGSYLNSSNISPNLSRNTAYIYDSNLTNIYGHHESANLTKVSDGEEGDVGGAFKSDKNAQLDDNSGSSDYGGSEDEARSKDFLLIKRNSTVEGVGGNNSFPSDSNITSEKNFSLDWEDNISPAAGQNGNLDMNAENTSVASSLASSPLYDSPKIADVIPDMLPSDKGTIENKVQPDDMQRHVSPSIINSSASKVPLAKGRTSGRVPRVVSISEMNNMMRQSHASFHSMKPRWSQAVDEELLHAKSLIESAPIRQDDSGSASIYRNYSIFKRSYELMEQTLKVYIYKEGDRPIFHQPVLKGIYASEGWFMKLLKANRQFVTKNPRKAHLFYLPFSSRMLEETLYIPNSHSRKNLVQYLNDYLNLIKTRYRFWNRTGGADHFLVACHDWAPAETTRIMAHCIRALCNADVREGFIFGKDVSLPETNIRSAKNPLRELGGKPPSQRKILAFFAGNMHGYLRPVLLQYWQNKDPDMKIFGKISKVKGEMSYAQYMKSSKYCICAKGYEVNSPRVVEAIFYECVPVIISDNFVPPFFETLNWESFAVFVLEKDIPDLKNILSAITQERYLEMQRMVKQVQQHFLWHPRPVKYDIFHMILHSIWYNRVFNARTS